MIISMMKDIKLHEVMERMGEGVLESMTKESLPEKMVMQRLRKEF
jgi:hypothetical protein